jgi:hypothetical protein
MVRQRPAHPACSPTPLSRPPHLSAWPARDDASRIGPRIASRPRGHTWLGIPQIAPSAFIPDTNVIERPNEEFRRRVKTRGALPTEEAALVLLFGLVISGQIRLRRLDGWRQIPAILRTRRESAA